MIVLNAGGTMVQAENTVELFLDPLKRKEANETLIGWLQGALREGRHDLHRLRHKLTITYWIIVLLSIVMFVVGVLLLSVPFLAAFRGEIAELNSLIAAGFGIADLVALLLFKPIERMHNLMGDMSQIIVAINSFQSQVALRLLEMELPVRSTIGEAAAKIAEAAKESIRLVQEYFEATTKP
jgi:hypothetical protein